MNKRQKWESRVIKRQMKKTGYTYNHIKRLLINAVLHLTKKHGRDNYLLK